QLASWRMSSNAGGSRAGDGASEALADVRLSPDAGIQTFPEPYPSIHRDGTMRRSYIPGRAIVHVSAVKGDWAQVSVDGDVVGWVDGRQLLPPVSGSMATPGRETHRPSALSRASNTPPRDLIPP